MSEDESFREEELELPTIEQIETAINMLPWWKKIIYIVLTRIGSLAMITAAYLIDENLKKVMAEDES